MDWSPTDTRVRRPREGAGRLDAAPLLLGKLQSRDEKIDQAAGVVAGVGVGADAEVTHAAHQFVGGHVEPGFAGGRCGVQSAGTHRHQAVDEIGVQRLISGVVGSQHRRKSVFGDQQIGELVDPSRQRGVWTHAAGQQSRTGFRTCLYLMSVDCDDEVCGCVGKCR